MKKTLLCCVLLVLTSLLGTGVAAAADLNAAAPAPAVPAVTAPPVCAAQAEAAQPAEELFVPKPQPAAICPLIGCADGDFCRRDRDCTAAPGGVCHLFCPTRGCCGYPA